jgi:hypothetical protein
MLEEEEIGSIELNIKDFILKIIKLFPNLNWQNFIFQLIQENNKNKDKSISPNEPENILERAPLQSPHSNENISAEEFYANSPEISVKNNFTDNLLNLIDFKTISAPRVSFRVPLANSHSNDLERTNIGLHYNTISPVSTLSFEGADIIGTTLSHEFDMETSGNDQVDTNNTSNSVINCFAYERSLQTMVQTYWEDAQTQGAIRISFVSVEIIIFNLYYSINFGSGVA